MYDLKKGNVYLVEEERLALAPQLFLMAAEGNRGLVITRRSLDMVEEGDLLGVLPNYRLSLGGPRMRILSPHNIAVLSYKLTDFLDDPRPGAILLEGLEYLMVQNDFQTVLRLMQFLNERVSVSRCTMVVSVNPMAFDLKDFHLLLRETVRPSEGVMEEGRRSRFARTSTARP